MLSANCQAAREAVSGDVIWTNGDEDRTFLMASCTEIENPSATSTDIIAKDCINGTLMPRSLFEYRTNYTSVNRIFADHGASHVLDHNMLNVPFDTGITIYDKTKVSRL